MKGKRIGLITNPTGKDNQGRSTAEVLASAPGVTLAALFSPEHGITGNIEVDKVKDGTFRLGGRDIPVHSLYGGDMETMRPKQDKI